MKAISLLRERRLLSKGLFVELVVWQVPTPVRGSIHTFKYRLALVAGGECVLRYDNEAGKGDHRHLGNDELPYSFISAPQLLADFWADVDRWRFEHADRNA